jgi:flavin-dependent dehydrogenase
MTGAGAGRAVVVGAGIAGLLAARVLSETFAEVTILDRDPLGGAVGVGDGGIGVGVGDGGDGDGRRGVPQGRHLHGLMDRGRQIMAELYPGLVDELIARGASTTEILVGNRWYLGGLRTKPTPTGLVSVLASRPLLEDVLRERTLARPGVRVRTGVTVTGLVPADGNANRIAGVRLRALARDEDGPPDENGPAGGELLPADLVVDASGRGSRAGTWLTALGHAAPRVEEVDVDLGYTSRVYRRRPGDLGGASSVIIGMPPGRPGGGAVPLEGDRWLVTLVGMLGEHPPRDPAGFEAFAATLAASDIAELMKETTPLSSPLPYRFRGSRRRRYDRLRRPPAGFLAVGDALCSLNPLYAQGMTVAAQQALALRDCLADRRRGGPDGRSDLPRRFYRAAGPAITVAWDMCLAADLRHPGVTIKAGPRDRFASAYSARAQRAAHRDPVVARALVRVINLIDPPTALMRPAVAARVLARGGEVA